MTAPATPPPVTTLIVGGYGSVGRTIATELATPATGSVADAAPAEVVLAGRDGERAARVAASIGGATGAGAAVDVSGVAFDVTDAASYDRVLDGVDQVVVCLDLPDTAFAAGCLERGIDYVDVTASDEIVREIEALDDVATEAGATAVLSVGLAPGVTNLLAARATNQLDAVEDVRIGVLLGLGEAFGPAASRWTLERIGREFTAASDRPRRVRGFTDARPMSFPGYGDRPAYRFDFADQHAIARTLGVPAESRLCFDSRALSAVIAGSARSGLYDRVVAAVGLDRLVDLVERLPGGGDGFAGTVEADGHRGGTPTTLTASIDGREQSRVTGLVAALVSRTLGEASVPAGVHHVHELVEPATVLDALVGRGCRFTESETRH